MDDPWSRVGRLASLRAPHAHDRLRRRARASRARSPTTSAPATTCSRSPTTGTGARPPSSDRAARPPERRAQLRAPGDRDGHVLGFGDRPRACASSRASVAISPRRPTGSPAHGGVAYLAHPYWTVRDAGDSRAAADRHRDRGLQRRLRARGRARPLVRALGRAARGGRSAPRSRPTTATIRVRLGPAPGRGCARRADARRACSTRLAYGRVLRHDRARDPGASSRTAAPSTCAARPCRSVTLLIGTVERRRRERGPARLPLRRRGPRARRRTTGSSRRASTCRRRRRTRGSRSPIRTGRGRGRTRYGRLAAATARAPRRRAGGARRGAVRPARDRRRRRSAQRSRRTRRAQASRVALVDAGDFGRATSSASSKLIHGGLRYLRLGDVRLVREAHHERRPAGRLVAPHLVQRLPFLLPLYHGGPFRPAFVQSGILLYSTLARSRLNWLVEPTRAQRLVPPLRRDGLRSCALYADAWTNDARLCLENVLAAADAGATVLNCAEVVDLGSRAGASQAPRSLVDGDVVDVRARVRQRRRPVGRRRPPARGSARRTSVRLSKGVTRARPGRARGRPRSRSRRTTSA